MARKSISQTKQQECKVADNANNKRKWEGNHNGQCTVKGRNCKKVGHMTRACRNPTAARNQQTHPCYECGKLGHYRRDCPERKNQSHKNQIGGTGAHRVVHTLRGGETDQDPNNKKDEIEA
ncbi:reverse transcriptase domain-containing protein [Tanacetum coccineum]